MPVYSRSVDTQFSFDFVDTPIADVARAVSLAYDTSILVDDGLDMRVTFHLEGVSLMEGLSALCEANRLELFRDGGVLHIKKRVDHGYHEFLVGDSLVSISVKNKDVREFTAEYALNTGLNILLAPEVQGAVTGELRNLSAKEAYTQLMEMHHFRVQSKSGVLQVGLNKLSEKGATEKQLWLDRSDSLYSIDVRDVPLAEVLRELAAVAELDLALYGEIHENVQLKFDAVDLRALVDALFKNRHYTYVLDQNRLLVSERGARKALAFTKLFPLKHIHSEKALNYLGKIPPSAEFVATEVKEQNALLLGGSHDEIKMAENLLRQVDVPALQVTLSCVVVEFKRGKNFELGLHSGATRKTGENDVGFRGFLDFMTKDFSKTGAFGKIGLLPDRFEMELSSMEERNEAEVLARPRLTTMNGNKSELNVTNTVYYLVSQVSADGYPITDYRSFNDGISLELTPIVTQQGSITLEVSPEIKTAGRSTGDGPRDISTRNLKTVVVLKDGETLCLGGLIRKNQSEVRSAVPFLGSLPVVGRLFSYVSQEEETNELAIFITPRVVRTGK